MFSRITALRTATPMSALKSSFFGRHCRRYGTQTKQSNPTSSFYKAFSRPVGKVLLLAVFTYQVVYWTWVKLEADEMRQETDATIADLETTVDEYAKSKKG